MATAKKTPSGKYRVRIFDYTDENGKKVYRSFTAPTKKEAELLAAKYKTGAMHADELQTVAQCVEEYIQLKKAVLSPATVRNYKQLKRALDTEYPNFAKRTIRSLTQKDVQGFISMLADKKSPKTVRNYHGLLTASSEKIRGFKITLPQMVQYAPSIPTEAQIKTLLDYVKIDDKELEIPVMLASSCMMRRGEICGLSMNDVNFKNKTIHIRHSVVIDEDCEWVSKAPKTVKSDRIIKVPDFVLEAIKKQGYITTYNPTMITGHFKRALEACGLPHFRFHDLRHYCASMYHFQGVPMSYVQKYGGWSTMSTLVKIYQHTLKDKEDEVFGKMNDYFSKKYDSKYDSHFLTPL